MKKEKYYFESVDDTLCYPLDYYLDNAKENELKEITLIKAIPANNPNFTFCEAECEMVSKSDCRKSECSLYEANKSGRGTCIHRGKLYDFGEEVTFEVK